MSDDGRCLESGKHSLLVARIHGVRSVQHPDPEIQQIRDNILDDLDENVALLLAFADFLATYNLDFDDGSWRRFNERVDQESKASSTSKRKDQRLRLAQQKRFGIQMRWSEQVFQDFNGDSFQHKRLDLLHRACYAYDTFDDFASQANMVLWLRHMCGLWSVSTSQKRKYPTLDSKPQLGEEELIYICDLAPRRETQANGTQITVHDVVPVYGYPITAKAAGEHFDEMKAWTTKTDGSNLVWPNRINQPTRSECEPQRLGAVKTSFCTYLLDFNNGILGPKRKSRPTIGILSPPSSTQPLRRKTTYDRDCANEPKSQCETTATSSTRPKAWVAVNDFQDRPKSSSALSSIGSTLVGSPHTANAHKYSVFVSPHERVEEQVHTHDIELDALSRSGSVDISDQCSTLKMEESGGVKLESPCFNAAKGLSADAVIRPTRPRSVSQMDVGDMEALEEIANVRAARQESQTVLVEIEHTNDQDARDALNDLDAQDTQNDQDSQEQRTHRPNPEQDICMQDTHVQRTSQTVGQPENTGHDVGQWEVDTQSTSEHDDWQKVEHVGEMTDFNHEPCIEQTTSPVESRDPPLSDQKSSEGDDYTEPSDSWSVAESFQKIYGGGTAVQHGNKGVTQTPPTSSKQALRLPKTSSARDVQSRRVDEEKYDSLASWLDEIPSTSRPVQLGALSDKQPVKNLLQRSDNDEGDRPPTIPQSVASSAAPVTSDQESRTPPLSATDLPLHRDNRGPSPSLSQMKSHQGSKTPSLDLNALMAVQPALPMSPSLSDLRARCRSSTPMLAMCDVSRLNLSSKLASPYFEPLQLKHGLRHDGGQYSPFSTKTIRLYFEDLRRQAAQNGWSSTYTAQRALFEMWNELPAWSEHYAETEQGLGPLLHELRFVIREVLLVLGQCADQPLAPCSESTDKNLGGSSTRRYKRTRRT